MNFSRYQIHINPHDTFEREVYDHLLNMPADEGRRLLYSGISAFKVLSVLPASQLPFDITGTFPSQHTSSLVLANLRVHKDPNMIAPCLRIIYDEIKQYRSAKSTIFRRYIFSQYYLEKYFDPSTLYVVEKGSFATQQTASPVTPGMPVNHVPPVKINSEPPPAPKKNLHKLKGLL